MKIAFDAKRITHNTTGLGNYGRYIVNILAQYYPDNSYLLYSPQKGKQSLNKRIISSASVIYKYPKQLFPVIGKSLWRSFGIISCLKKEQPNLFHGLSNELPFGLRKNKIKSVVTIHDLIFIRYPDFYKWIDRNIYYFKFKKACLTANRIIAISECTKKDIVTYFHIPEEKIDVVYQGCDPSFLEKASVGKKQEVRTKYNLPHQYMLYVGSIESRKNLMLIIEAMALSEKKIHLVAIGKRTNYTPYVEECIQKYHLDNDVTLLSNIPFHELPSFYQMASLFIYPSFFEGFGIPVIEALHSEVPVIAATGSCLEEAGGPDSLYVNPNNAKELHDKIRQVLDNPELAGSMRIAGKEYVKRFADKKLAQDLIEVYNKVLTSTNE